MLARIEAMEGVGAAGVDRSGVLLRLDATPQAAARVGRELTAWGYEAAPLPDGERDDVLARVAHWHGADAAADLSAEEADVLARRIVGAFGRDRAVADGSAALEDLVRDELTGAFAASRAGAPLTSASDRCAQAVCERAVALLGATEAARLGDAVRAALATGDASGGLA